MSNPVTTALFDAAGTLIYLPRTVGDSYREVALRFGADLPAEALNRAFVTAWKSAPARENTSGPRPDDDKGWWRALVRQVLIGTMPEGEWRNFGFDAYFEAVYAYFAEPGVWRAFPEAAEVLAALQARGLKLAVVSNFDRRLHAVLAHLDLSRFFTAVIISSEVGADKPDPSIFQAALAALGTRATEAVHVGDDPKRDWGASVAGLRVYELRRPECSLRDLLPWLDAAGREEKALASTGEMP